MSNQAADQYNREGLDAIKFPSHAETVAKMPPGFGTLYGVEPPPTPQQQAEMEREHARIVELTRYDWVGPAVTCVVGAIALGLVLRWTIRHMSAAKGKGRGAVVFSLFLGIRGARKVTGAAKGMWAEAKEADRKVTEIERGGGE